jgi:hypothetical protein
MSVYGDGGSDKSIWLQCTAQLVVLCVYLRVVTFTLNYRFSPTFVSSIQSWIYVISLTRSLHAIMMSHKCRHRTVKIIPYLHFARLFR